MNLSEAKKAIVEMGHTLIEKRLVAGSWGNISCKYTEEDLFPKLLTNGETLLFGKASSAGEESNEGIAITPSGIGYQKLSTSDIVSLDLDGVVLEGEHNPSSETQLHLAIYKYCPEAGAVIHTHSTYASALSAMHEPVPALIEDIVQICGGRVNCAEYAICGTRELATAAIEALEPTENSLNKKACLLANHGAVCWGKTLEDALIVAEVLEKAAQIAIICKQCGGGVELDANDSAEMHRFYMEHYNKRQIGEE